MRERKNSPQKRNIRRVIMVVILTVLCITVYRTSIISIKQSNLFSKKVLLQKNNKSDSFIDWNILLVNKDHPVPDDYEIDFTELSNGERIDSRIYPELQSMFDDARARGMHLFVREGYRTMKEQQQVMNEKVKKYMEDGHSKQEAKRLAEEYVAIPGTSEHQLGLSVDINADTSKTPSSEVYAWLAENSYKYGFVKRYPSDKVDITGINDEPWHYRYVGKKVAKEMKEKNLCLEEYLEQLE